MSESDSFLSEVSEEVRRDRMVMFLRRNAVWIGGALVLIIGGVAYLEWQRASTQAAAQARGDALWAALSASEGAERLEALSGVEIEGADGSALLNFQRAAAHLDADAADEAVTLLQAIAGNGSVSEPLRSVARLKLAGVATDLLTAQEREDLLLPMIDDGHALRSLALEQRAMLRLEAGDAAAAIADFEAIGNDPRAPAGVQDRAEQFLTILSPGDAANG